MIAPRDPASPAASWPAIIELLTSIWPRLATAIPTAARLGADWTTMSRPCVIEAGGRILAHAGLLEIPLVVDGIATTAMGVHAVCSAIDARGRGLARRVIEEAIAAASGSTLVLHANDPAIYRRFGFRDVPQVAFFADVERGAKATPMQRLDHTKPSDVARVYAAFATRTPVSNTLGVGAAAQLFVLDEVLGCGGFARLWWSDELECVVACELDDDHVLQIYDIVARELPSLAELVARVPGRIDRVELVFVPDRLGGRWRTRELEPPDVFMVRGPFTSAAELVLPPLARC